MATSSSAAAEAPQRTSSAARLIGVFASPGKTMAELAADPHFILCWIVQIVVSISFFEFLLHRVGAQTMAMESLMQNGRLRNNPAALQQALPMVTKMFQIAYPIIQPVAVVAIMLLLAVIFWGVANLVLGLETRFKQLVAIVSYGSLPLTLFWVIAALVSALLPDPTAFNLTNPLGTNLAYFMNQSTSSPFLYQMAVRVDIFAVWVVLLLALGLTKLGGKRGKFSSSLACVLGLYVFYALCIAGITALTS